MENIEIYQQGSNKKFEQLCPKGIVFNLEIEDNHTYIAENIIVHNCHHNRAASWTCILEHFKASKKLHVTATPIRLDGKGLGVACKGFADTLIIGPSTQELINLGFLAKVSIYAPPVGINIEGIKKTMGDYNKKELSDCIDKSYITGNAIAHYKRICPTSKAIAYCVSLQHAENITLEFKRAGESAVMIDGRMNEKTRNNIVKDFATDKIKILVSVDLISEGFDAPQASCGIMLRPTASLGLWLQQCGRILRPYPNKTEAIILDHAGNSLKHGLPTETRDWTLEGEKTPEMKKQQLLKLRTCKQCYAVFKAYLNVCPQCQNEYELSPREIEEREGELQKIEEVKQKWTQKAEIYNAKDLATLTELGKQRGYRYPRIWAEHIIRARIRKKESKVF